MFLTIVNGHALVGERDITKSIDDFWALAGTIQGALYEDRFIAVVVVDSNQRLFGYSVDQCAN